MAALEKALRRSAGITSAEAAVHKRCRARAKKMLEDLKAKNPKAAAMVTDPSPHISGICPRRSGKTYSAVLTALIVGEAQPGAIALVISLNKKQLKRLYWEGAPSGIHKIAAHFGVKLEYHGTDLKWTHENGSFGYLLGADDDEQLEVIRGLEADLYIVDECKSFAPLVLAKLIDDIIDPQRNSRQGRLMLIGTPGHITSGPFYQATCPEAKDSEGRPYLVGIDKNYAPTERVDAWGRTPVSDLLWSCHHWDMSDNTALPHQWENALTKKRARNITDDDPTWLREYRGRWAVGGAGLVYRYALSKQGGKCTWVPAPTADNPTGLPAEGAPWRLIGGLDIGYEAPTALVVGAYSRTLGELRHVADYLRSHMLVGDIAALLYQVQDQYGPLEQIYCDTGNLGKMVVKSLVQDYGFPLTVADKREKYDHIELVNDAFDRGEIKIIEGTALEAQLLTDAWKVPDERPETVVELARRGKLREDDSIPNDAADAFLYMFRGSVHQFRTTPAPPAPDVGTEEWVHQYNREQLAKARAQIAAEEKFNGDTRMTRAPSFVRRAMDSRQWRIPIRPSN